MKQAFCIPILVITAIASQEVATETGERNLSVDSFELHGDCIGMGPAMGKPGSFIQSDMQFVQKVQDEIRQLYPHGEDGSDHTIPPEFNMSLYTRFFINDSTADKK